MTAENRKKREMLHLNYFRQVYQDFPAGKLIVSESPDFIVRKTLKSSVGIELTSLHPNHLMVRDKPAFPEQRLVRLLRELTETYVKENLFVKVEFSQIPLDESLMLPVAARTAVIMRKRLSLPRGGDYHLITGQNALPPHIRRILIIRNRQSDYSAWEKAEPVRINTDFQADLQALTVKKDEKLRLYMSQKLTEYWLLILTDKLQGKGKFHIRNMIENMTIVSAFQKVFLFELMEENVYRLC